MPPSDSTANIPKVRTRKGCLTCRKRRRKCDEQKPRCQNCTGRGLDCRYGLKLTFLAGNVSSLAPEDAQALQDSAPGRYKNLRFVNGLDEVESHASEGNEHHDDETLFNASANLNNSVEDITSSTVQDNDSPENSEDDGPEILGDDDTQPNQDTFEEQQPVTASYPSISLSPYVRSMPSALTRVISNEAIDYDRSILNKLSSQSTRQTFSIDLSPGSHSSPTIVRSASSHLNSILGSVRSPGRSQVSHVSGDLELVLEKANQKQLVKFYMDEIAPRLDVCSTRISFGVQIPIMARDYKPLLYSILALAALQKSCSLSLEIRDDIHNAELAQKAMDTIGSDIYSTRIEAIAACALLLMNRLLSTKIQYWRPFLEERIQLLSQLGIEKQQDSLSWFILRLDTFNPTLTIDFEDLALSIFCGTALITQLSRLYPGTQSFLNPFPDSVDDPNVEDDRNSEYTRRSILLCAQAIQLRFMADVSHRTVSSTIENWNHLWKSILAWQQHLPSSMFPILQSRILAINSTSPASFPLILHTSRSNMYAAVMHHLSSVLLLEIKPPSERLSSHIKSATWHAIRICGICIGNNSDWSHDPTILAAVISAGRYISYGEQKKELLQNLRILVKGSGWKVESAVGDMVKQWQVDGGRSNADTDEYSFENSSESYWDYLEHCI